MNSRSNRPAEQHDASDLAELERQLMEASAELASMSEDYAAARSIREYDGERKKIALAKHIAPLLADKHSVSAAEHMARASESYLFHIDALAQDLTNAEAVIAKHRAIEIRWESIRSCLSLAKTLSNNL